MYQMYDLSAKDLTVLIALQENPLITYDEIEEKLKGKISRGTIHNILKKLSIPANRNYPYFHAIATLNLNNLGLEMVNTLVYVNNEAQLQKIEKLCDFHPYTLYRSRCFGDTNGLLIQFRIPQGKGQMIKELLEIAKNKELLEKFIILPFNKPPIYTTPKLSFWNQKTLQWTFQWENWFNEEIIQSPSLSKNSEIINSREWLTKKDLAIIAELGYNARRKNIEIIEGMKRRNEECVKKGENTKDYYEFTTQTFSRHLIRIEQECIDQYRLFVDPQCFDIATTVFIWGSGDKDAIEKLGCRVKKNPIPFASTFIDQGSYLFWYLHLPMTHLSELMFHLRKILSDLHFNFIDYPRSKNYLIWPETFDEKSLNWRIDKEFMIDDVLKNI